MNLPLALNSPCRPRLRALDRPAWNPATAALLHRDSLCPTAGSEIPVPLDERVSLTSFIST